MLVKTLFHAKLKALSVHALLSLVVALVVAYIVFFLWYPNPFGFASGGLKLFLLVTGVDLVLGPALTFVAFDPLKKKVLMLGDFVVIALLQISALIYGINAVFVSRPVAVVFEESRFRAVPAGELEPKDLERAPVELRTLSLTGPKLIGTRVLTAKEQGDAIFEALNGRDIGQRPEFWSPYEKEQGRIKGLARPVDLLLKQYPGSESEIKQLAKEKGIELKSLGFMSVLSKQGVFTLLLSRETGDFVGYVLVDGSF